MTLPELSGGGFVVLALCGVATLFLANELYKLSALPNPVRWVSETEGDEFDPVPSPEVRARQAEGGL
jgi:hypothetical protein